MIMRVPPIEVQREIVAEIKDYEREIERLTRDVTVQEANIQTLIDQVWGKDRKPVFDA